MDTTTHPDEIELSEQLYLYVVYLDKRGPVRKRVMLEVSRVKKRLGPGKLLYSGPVDDFVVPEEEEDGHTFTKRRFKVLDEIPTLLTSSLAQFERLPADHSGNRFIRPRDRPPGDRVVRYVEVFCRT